MFLILQVLCHRSGHLFPLCHFFGPYILQSDVLRYLLSVILRQQNDPVQVHDCAPTAEYTALELEMNIIDSPCLNGRLSVDMVERLYIDRL